MGIATVFVARRVVAPPRPRAGRHSSDFFPKNKDWNGATRTTSNRSTMTQAPRDEADAIEEKLRHMDEELARGDASSARGAALREANELARRLKDARRSPLDDVRIASPCSARWDDMVGDDRVRHCAACDKDVFDISGMTRAEAVELVTKSAGVCIRMFKRADGTVMTADCPVGVRKKRVRRLAVLGAGISAALGGGLLYAWVEPASVAGVLSSTGKTADVKEREAHTMGSAAVPTMGTAAPMEPPAAKANRPATSSKAKEPR